MPVQINNKPIEIFCGTGGVGKTTLATSRALYLASNNKKVLLITIDPAKRLKQILKLSNHNAGKIKKINSKLFSNHSDKKFTFDALLMSPAATLSRIGEINNSLKELANPILKILTRPYGGTNEIMSIIEVQHHLASNKYDSVVLDTPPGKHFIDFLQSSQKIQQFFDKTFIEVFKVLEKSFYDSKLSIGAEMLSVIVSSGVKRLITYLEKVTGSTFVEEFVDAVVTLYKNKNSFLDALTFQSQLKEAQFSNWFLVTSVDQQKLYEANHLQTQAELFMHKDNFLAINKCLNSHLTQWQPPDLNADLNNLKSSMLKKENALKSYASKSFSKIIEFDEILKASPAAQVGDLATKWQNWGSN